MQLFCPRCHAYIPIGEACPSCGQPRAPLMTPVARDKALWRAALPGSIAKGLTVAASGGRPLLLAPWSPTVAQPGDAHRDTSGVIALNAATGQVAWAYKDRAPIEDGVTVAGDVVYVGSGRRGFGAGQGWVTALDLAVGEVRWRTSVAGTVRASPAVEGRRVYVTAGDGALHTLDAENGQPVGRSIQIASRPVPMAAAPITAREGGMVTLILGSYSARHGREPAQVVALDNRQRQMWRREVDGNVHGTPAVAHHTLYVTAYGERPSRGQLFALDLRAGTPIWDRAFTVACEPGSRSAARFVAGPLVCDDTVYIGSLDHHLYAVDAARGVCRWSFEAERGIATTPTLIEGLLVFGDNGGTVYAIERETGREVWRYQSVGRAMTSPHAFGDAVFAGWDNGTVAALPWHLGNYEWAAARLEAATRLREAGDCWALAGCFENVPDRRERALDAATRDWLEAGAMERIVAMWQAWGRQEKAAEALTEAGEHWRFRDREKAAAFFTRAAYQFYLAYRQRRPHSSDVLDRLVDNLRRASQCAQLPLISAQCMNATLARWEKGQLILTLLNEGFAPFEGTIQLQVSGQLLKPIDFALTARIGIHEDVQVPITMIAGETDILLEVGLAYPLEGYGIIHSAFALNVHAADRPRPPYVIGDIGVLHLAVGGTTAEGVTIEAGGDIGMIKASAQSARASDSGEGRNGITEIKDISVKAGRGVGQVSTRISGGGGITRLEGLTIEAEQDIFSVTTRVSGGRTRRSDTANAGSARIHDLKIDAGGDVGSVKTQLNGEQET